MEKKRPTEKDVEVLMTFLADGSEQTVQLARRQLRAILDQHPGYRRILENAPDPQLAHEARLFLEETRLDQLEAAFRSLAAGGDDLDLEAGACLLAQVVYPGLRTPDVARTLDEMAAAVRRVYAAERLAPAQAVALLRRTLFDEMGFRGNEENYYDPDNSYLNRVLERRLGIPISLSCVYLFVAWRLGLAAHGIGLPGHFIVGHALRPGVIYVDPFRGGRLLRRSDCVRLVRGRGMVFQDSFLAPTPNRQILARLIANLVNLYTEQGAAARAQWLGRVLGLLQEAA